MGNILLRLRNIFHNQQVSPLTNMELHDLTCFVIHRLLTMPPFSPADSMRATTSECLRYGMALYLLNIHGTTYYSHADLVNSLITRLTILLKVVTWTDDNSKSLRLWITSVGMVATRGTADSQFFVNQAYAVATAFGLQAWGDIVVQLESILWVSSQQGEVFRHRWEEVLMAVHTSSVSHSPFQIFWSPESESHVENQT